MKLLYNILKTYLVIKYILKETKKNDLCNFFTKMLPFYSSSTLKSSSRVMQNHEHWFSFWDVKDQCSVLFSDLVFRASNLRNRDWTQQPTFQLTTTKTKLLTLPFCRCLWLTLCNCSAVQRKHTKMNAIAVINLEYFRVVEAIVSRYLRVFIICCLYRPYSLFRTVLN